MTATPEAMADMAAHRAIEQNAIAMSKAWDRMAQAAMSKDSAGFEQARSEFWQCAPQETQT